MKVQKITEIWLVKKRHPRPIDLVQYDTGVQIVFALQDFTIPDGTTATLYVQKPSGAFVYQETGITVDGNTITIDLENQAITEHGNDIPYQVQMKNGGDTITTFAGIFRVEKSLADDGAVKSKTVVAAFEAKTAEQIAQIEAAAQEQLEIIRSEYPELYAVKDQVTLLTDSTANAIKGRLSGAVVAADDVSPVEHSPIVKVHGKNLFDISKISTMTPSESAYVSEVGSDYIVITTPEGYVSNGYCTISRPLKEFCPNLQVGKRYVINATTQSNSANIYLPKVGKSWIFGQPMVMTEDILSSSVTFYGLSAQHGQGVGDCTISNIQVEEGDTATEYTPYIDTSTVKVRRCGKNIFSVAAKSQTQNGVTFTVNSDGSVTANGTAEKATFIGLGSLVLKPDEKYRLSGSPAGSGFDTYMLYIHNNTTGADIYDVGEGKVFTGKEGALGVTVAVYAGVTVNNLVFRPLVVYGEDVVAFEPYNGAEYIPAADGTVSGITSVSPNMTILTDTDGVTVECEYIRDTNKVVDKLVKAITALGGTV